MTAHPQLYDVGDIVAVLLYVCEVDKLRARVIAISEVAGIFSIEVHEGCYMWRGEFFLHKEELLRDFLDEVKNFRVKRLSDDPEIAALATVVLSSFYCRTLSFFDSIVDVLALLIITCYLFA